MTSIARFTTVLLLLAGSAAWAAETVEIEAGSRHEGTVETGNTPIRIHDGATVDGDVESRNGAVTLGTNVTAGEIRTRNGLISTGGGGHFGDLFTRNGTITLGPDSRAGEVGTRNGNITVGADSRVEGIESRNGSVALRDRVQASGGVGTRNGAIRGGEAVQVGQGVASRNGAVAFARGSRIEGDIETRNGSIQLQGAEAGGSLRSRSGNIELGTGTEITGDVRIEIDEDTGIRIGGFLWFGGSTEYPDAGDISVREGSIVHGDLVVLLPADYDAEFPTVTIDGDSRVLGTVRVDARANLEITDGAGTGSIERAEH